MSKKEWGNITWILFHSLCEKIKDECFEEERGNLIHQITSIALNVPCPTCSSHAKGHISNIKFDRIKTKQDLIQCIWTFHNVVNKHTKKPTENYDIVNKYQNANLNNIIDKFINIYTRSFVSNRYIMYSFHSKRAVLSFLKYMKQSKHKFNF